MFALITAIIVVYGLLAFGGGVLLGRSMGKQERDWDESTGRG